MTTGQDWNRLDWTRLAAYVIRHRQDLGYNTTKAFADATGLSYKTVLRVERAEKPVGRDTLSVLEKHLRWKPGSATAILHGGEPASEETAGVSPTALAELRAASRADLDRVYTLVEVVLGRDVADAWSQRAMELRSLGAPKGTSSPQTTRREVG
ncbi:hypothetical protein AB0J55_17530 [Amycolatopsis sp. NPDC049688]|uniref:hypothetical protein n=1 Tax=Amycolatopsis sp. NPDC049688 TaxID=3154733 RepID=UPI00341354CC